MQSYKTFHNDPYSIAKYRSDKSYPLLFILLIRQLHRFHLPRNQSKTRRSIPVYLHLHIPGPDNDPSVYSQHPPLAGAVLIGAITTHRTQYSPIDRRNQNLLRCPQPPFHSYLKGTASTLLLIIRCRFRSVSHFSSCKCFSTRSSACLRSNATASSKSSLRSDGRLQAT